MDQRGLAINMVGLLMVLVLFVSVPCFIRYMRLSYRYHRRYISPRRFEMYRYHHRRQCNAMGLAVIGIVAICWLAAEAGFTFF